jgi:hypothetical protein
MSRGQEDDGEAKRAMAILDDHAVARGVVKMVRMATVQVDRTGRKVAGIGAEVVE